MKQAGSFSALAIMALRFNGWRAGEVQARASALHHQDAMAKDLRGALKRIVEFGYQEVETYGFNYGNNKYYWGLRAETSRTVARRMRSYDVLRSL